MEFVPPRGNSPAHPPRPGVLRGASAPVLCLLLAFPACQADPTLAPLTWSQRLAVGRLDQAEAEFGRGDPAARITAGLALAEARAAGHAPTIAQAQALLGALEGNLPRLQDGLHQLELLGDTAGAASARLWLAELAVQAGRPDVAVPVLAAAVAALPSNLSGRLESAGTEARVYHLQATALRLDADFPAAAAAERRAALALTLLPEDELLPLRTAVAQACGDDLLRAGDARAALARFAEASSLARRSADRPAELRALVSLATGLHLDGHHAEAADHCQRALYLARALSDATATREAGARGLSALQALGEPANSPRWEEFRLALTGG
jgi:tetratricopeptide (TPR) repeat protein